MKYIAFPETYNEQIFDSVEQTITWTKRLHIPVKSIRPILNKVWKKLNNYKEQF